MVPGLKDTSTVDAVNGRAFENNVIGKVERKSRRSIQWQSTMGVALRNSYQIMLPLMLLALSGACPLVLAADPETAGLVQGTANNDVLTGGSSDETIAGGGGDDD